MALKPQDIGEIAGQLDALQAVLFCVCGEVKSADEGGDVSKRIAEKLSKYAMKPRTDPMPVDVEECHYARVRTNNSLLEKFLDLFS